MFVASELLAIVVMALAIGWLFMDSVPAPAGRDPIQQYTRRRQDKLLMLKRGVLAAAPAVVLHELAHKFVGMALGLNAVLHAAYGWLFFGVVLKMVGFPIIFVPGYVSLWGNAPPLAYAIVSLAGPLANLLLWFVSGQALKRGWGGRDWAPIWHVSKQINMFLFVLNMLPIPPLDGFGFVMG
ncbi:hypothetical protein COY28_06600, partial [Candidatus Woesearchaeota archaeon CG_4_10_14_0_2_um_filter_57_5]